MARLTIGQKAERVLTLLLALRNPRIAAALARHGFKNKDLDEGWNLLRAVTRTRLDVEPDETAMDPDALRTLDEWENQWFGIAAATLQRRAPNVHDWLFRNLSQTDGVEVLVSVGTFLERWDLLDKAETDGGLGNEGKAAKKLLGERGLTKDTIGEAKVLMEKLRKIDGPLPDLEKIAAEEANFDKAEQELWGWYLEWSAIARKTIKQRSLLLKLGFLRSTSRGDEEVPDDGSAETTQNETQSDERDVKGR
ncbi:MAG TPA: hypothetical protein PK156_21595 [Polyangium sp.]|nr:hypothetical protein [Polyangium sp.]